MDFSIECRRVDAIGETVDRVRALLVVPFETEDEIAHERYTVEDNEDYN
jgi:hypothetical protein